VEREGILVDVPDKVAAISEPVGGPAGAAVGGITAVVAITGISGVSKTMYHFRRDIFTHP
jgi:hypothetical protein